MKVDTSSTNKTVVLRNSFHGTAVRVRPPIRSRAQVRRIRKALCGVDGCLCGNALKAHGPQDKAGAVVITSWYEEGCPGLQTGGNRGH